MFKMLDFVIVHVIREAEQDRHVDAAVAAINCLVGTIATIRTSGKQGLISRHINWNQEITTNIV